MKKGQVPVLVEKLPERYCGEPTGRAVYHTSVMGLTVRYIPRGCPLGRGYTEQESLWDFCFRANGDNPSLNLTVEQLRVTERHDRYGKPVNPNAVRPTWTGD